MGWITEGAYEHEGWVANVLADGRATGGSTRDGVILSTPPTAADETAGYVRRPYPDVTEVIVPWDQVVTWRATCTCGWVGAELPAVTDPEYVWSRDCPEDLADREFYPAWKDHVAPIAALAELGESAAQLRDVEAEVADKARLARAAGASWSQIGLKVGLTKQGAQQRWGSTSEVD